MSLFTWLFKDEAEVIKERLAQADRDNKALERALDSLKERVRTLESLFRQLELEIKWEATKSTRVPSSSDAVRRSSDSYEPVYPTTRDEGATTALIVAGMVLSSSYDSSSSASSSCGGGD